MDPLAFKIERDVEAGVLVASWDDPEGGGITTQAENLTELAEAIKESVRCHFAGRSAPREVSLHFESDPVLQLVWSCHAIYPVNASFRRLSVWDLSRKGRKVHIFV
jgi:hypothetical protein